MGRHSTRGERNVYVAVRNLEYYGGNHCRRQSYKILRTLYCEGSYTLRRVWQKISSCNISYEANSIYFDNYKTCYSGYTQDCKPRMMYSLKFPYKRKIEDALVYNAIPPATYRESVPQEFDKRRSCLITVFSDRWLVRYHPETGKTLEEVYLSPRYNFKEISWNYPQESIVLQSTHSRIAIIARQAGITTSLVKVLAVFRVLPLQFVGMMEISKTVFGKDVTDSRILQGMLVVMHQTGRVQIYSFDRLIEESLQYEAPLYETIPGRNDVCGENPFGLPMNIVVEECPPVLFQVKCADHSVEIGGFPWHYLMTPCGQQGEFHVYSMETKKLAVNGRILSVENDSIEPDRAVFHGDESGRILHIGAETVRILKIVQDGADSFKVEETANISFRSNPVQYYEHRLCVDLDTVIQVIKPKQGKFHCCVYRLSGPVDDTSLTDGEKKPQSKIATTPM
ncbi:hypothetical protein ScPMuIL_008649 [Solemya velum]